mmetsp:Transcript_7226/g.7901  ORF Transcript_7226/g.7901 Transcript_7226/m.7901 type:complete len:733 (-) Transcript_7226:2260-4458(-)
MMEETAPAPPQSNSYAGAILEGAFVDPAYHWPPADGEGKNAVELKASSKLLKNEDDADLAYPAVPKIKHKRKVVTETEIVTVGRCGGFFSCCRSEEAVINTHTLDEPVDPTEKERLKNEYFHKREIVKRKRKEKKMEKKEKEKYNLVPEGVLVYRLDTAQKTITLCSAPSSNTSFKDVMTEMVIVDAVPSRATNRRGIMLTGDTGIKVEIVACEQRIATAWMEAINMMLGKDRNGFKKFFGKSSSNGIEEQYLNLTAYSNNLIRTGAIPSHKGKKKTTGGIYYTVEKKEVDGEEVNEEELESIAKRRAVIKDSWDFYRMICSLLRDRRKYDEAFRRLQMDPVYPYLNSMTGLNDPGDDAHGGEEVMQKDLSQYQDMTRTAVCKDLVQKAEEALPSLVEICKALAGSLGMEEVGVGPIKEISAAIRKSEKKYEGDVLKVKDYCRALLVVKDLPTLLALLELARDSFGPLIRRVKLSTFKSDHEALPGGYRDCKMNIELKDHICEIQIHVWPMYVICGVDGFRHYRHCLEYSTDSFDDPYDALANLDNKTLAELVVMAEEAVAGLPLNNLEWYHEKYILDYFAEVGIFLDHGLPVWAETTLRQLIKLRCQSPDIGANHIETQYLQKYLEKSLRLQGKKEEADEIKGRLASVESTRKKEKEITTKSLWDSIFTDPNEAFDLIMDPNKKEREEESRLKKEVRASKRAWRKIREKKFKFLDANSDLSVATESTGIKK